ncbi:T9SS type A sorting domain-containing protein [Saprospiraceae bacterium]|nr:T9SS type A sorting domain-containing protein [Saprospiraceae bacterium]
MSKFLLPFIAFIAISLSSLNAQNVIRCNTDEKAIHAYKDYNAFQKQIDKGIQEFYENPPNNKSSVVITIPVHVIIVHPPGQAVGSGSNFTLAKIQSQIDVLNEDFRRLNGDASNTPAQFAAADTEIEFCLAIVDESGNPTDGVTRYPTNLSMNNSENAIKAATGWDRDDYLNIWSAPNLGGILGWAYLPSTTNLPNATLDGVVIASTTFGGPGQGSNAPYDLGRTGTHEVGHYLGLRHIWRSNGCGADDGFADTPLQDDENYGCPNHPSASCSNSGDMFMNYMDYVNDNCMNAFTADQGDYMQLILNTSRSSLLGSANIVCGSSTPALEIELVFSQDLLCNGNNTGSLEVTATGGVPAYQYSINNGPLQSTGVFNNLAAGVYTLTVQDANASTSTLVTEIFEPTAVEVAVSAINDNSCSGFSDGSAFINITGGVMPYFVNGQSVSGNNFAITNLAAGNYTAFVVDANQCSQTIDFTITEPLPLTISIDAINHVVCNGQSNGSFSYSVFGGTPNYTVSLENSVLSSNTIMNLSAGTYTLDVEDNNGCLLSQDLTIEEPELLIASSTIDQNELCLDESNGIASILAEGGTGPFNYFLDDNPGTSMNVFVNLAAGAHQVNIIDLNGCSTTTSFTIEAGTEITSVVSNLVNAECGASDGSASILAQNGTFPYLYYIPELNLSNETGVFENIPTGNYTVEITDANNCTTSNSFMILAEAAAELNIIDSSLFTCHNGTTGSVEVELENPTGNPSYSLDGMNFQDSPIFEDLTGGMYTVFATDDSGCTSLVQFEVMENPEITFELTTTSVSCFGENNGTVNVVASGGNGQGFSYNLASEGGDIFHTAGLFENLNAGSDFIIIQDSYGCSQVVNFTIEEPAQMVFENIETSMTTCYGTNTGSASFSMQNNQGNINFVVTDIDGNMHDETSLIAGTYTVTATDDNGCMNTSTFEILDIEPIQWQTIQSTEASCDGSIRGTATFEALSGEAPFTYAVGQNSNMTGEFDNFNAGVYELTITDNTGCVRVVQFTIGQLEAYDYVIEELENILCFGDANGSATILGDGTDLYSYRMNDQENETGVFTDLEPGIYPFEIENGENCIVYDTLEITTPDELSLAVSDEVVNGNLLTDITLTSTGGVAPFTYNIDGGDFQESPIFTDIIDGNHSFSVMDANGCIITLDRIVLDLQADLYQDLKIYPNPVGQTLLIEFSLDKSTEIEFEVINLSGQTVHRQKNSKLHSGTNKIQIDLADKPAGIYFLKMQSDGNMLYRKIIKN